MNCKRLQLSIAILLCTLPFSYTAFAQQDTIDILDAELVLERTKLTVNETTSAMLILRNTTPYTLTNITVEPGGTAFQINNSPSLPDIMQPHSGTKIDYDLQGKNPGSYNIIFIVQYSWNDLRGPTTNQWIESVSANGIEVTDTWTFNWPEFLIPLLVGSTISLIVSAGTFYISDRYKQNQEEKKREALAKGVILAVLQTANQTIQRSNEALANNISPEKVSMSLWEESIVKSNLYPALHKFGQKIGEPQFSERLTKVSIVLSDYNSRIADGKDVHSIMDDLHKELTALIRIVETKG